MNSENALFVENARHIYGDKYIYSKVNYINTKEKICIICPMLGEFLQRADAHLQGQGCSKCAAHKNSKLRTSTTNKFIKKAAKVHQHRYDSSKANYESATKNFLLTYCIFQKVFVPLSLQRR